MPDVRIEIDGTAADFDNDVPISLAKRTDMILEIVGAGGTELDNEFESVTLPATTNNHQIFQQAALMHLVPGGGLLKNTVGKIDGAVFFSGSSVLRQIVVSEFPQTLLLEMLGDGLSVWTQLEGVSLRDLEMGTQEWSTANVETSWLATPTTGFKGIFAPVLYGKTTGEFAPGSWRAADMRLHVYFYSIIKAIFETRLGYSVVSNFFETEWFQRWVYLFGVGDDVRYENLPAKCSVHVYRIPGVAGTTDPIQYHQEYEDTCGEWDETGMTTLTADPSVPPSQDYTIEFSGSGTHWGTFEIEINGLVVYTTGPSYTVGGLQYFQIVKTFELTAGDTLTTHAYTDGGGSFFIYDVHLRAYTTPQPYEGADIVISSCLHDEPVKKFLRGLTQMFCLAWRVNEVTKQVFCEPRFAYRLYSSGSYTVHDGFYETPADPDDLENVPASNYSVEYLEPFGKELVMGYAKNESDPLFDSYSAGSETPGIPILGTRKPMAENGKSTVVENEFFAPLLLSSPDSTDASGGILPTILPDGYDITDEKIPTIDRTWRGAPTCGLVWAGAVTAIWDVTAGEESMPLISQYLPFRIGGANEGDLNGGTFADFSAQPVEDGQAAQSYKGLISTFYHQYLEMMKPATVISLQQPFSGRKFHEETFSVCKKLVTGNGSDIVAIIMELTGFDPVNTTPVGMRLLKWIVPTADEAGNITHNTVTITPPRPNGVCCDASANINPDGSDAEITVTGCREIKRVEVLVGNTRVYSGDLTAGTFGDATVAADKTITIDAGAIGTGVVTFTVNVTQDGCETKQTVRVLEF